MNRTRLLIMVTLCTLAVVAWGSVGSLIALGIAALFPTTAGYVAAVIFGFAYMIATLFLLLLAE